MLNTQLDPSAMKVLYKTPLVLEGQGGKSEPDQLGFMSMLQSGKSKPQQAGQMQPNQSYEFQPSDTYHDGDEYASTFNDVIGSFFRH
jgi:hypothetical protein